MANKTLLYGSESLAHDDQILYVEVSPGVYAPAVASIIISGAPGGTTPEAAAPVVNIEPALTDEITFATVTISTVHHEVHEGETFSVSLFGAAVPDDGFISILLRTQSNRYAHLTFAVAGGGDAQVRLLEGSTINLSGDQFTEYNMKRYSTNAAQVVASGNPTYAGGIVLTNFLLPGGRGGNSPGGVARLDTEWDLSLNTDYIIEVINIAGNAQPLSIVAQWYEESTA